MNAFTLFKFLIILLLCSIGIAQVDAQIPSFNENPEGTVVPLTPEAASFAKYIDHKVDKSTGLPSINLPLCNVKGFSMDIPISLSYHAGGVKVNEYSSQVGLGWSISGKYMISREMRGAPDEIHYFNNLLHVQNQDLPLIGANNNSIEASHTGILDAEPDLFYLNLPNGYSTKFIFDKNKNPIQHSTTGILIEGFPVDSGIDTSHWKITTPDGYVFFLGGKDAIEWSQSETNCGGGDPRPEVYTSSWYLYRIENPKGDIEFSFAYSEPKMFLQQSPKSESKTLFILGSDANDPNPDQLQCNSLDRNSSCETIIETHQPNLLFIYGRDQKIGFSYAPRQDDLDNDRLQFIAQFKNNGLIKYVKLDNDDFFYSPSLTLSPNPAASKRMKLKSVTHFSTNGTSLPATKFEYLDEISYKDYYVPAIGSLAQDHWGYHNGKIENSTLIPDIFYLRGNFILANIVAPLSLRDYIGGDRRADTTHVKAGMLYSITNAEGGKQIFDFESNEFTNYGDEKYLFKPSPEITVRTETIEPQLPPLPSGYTVKSFSGTIKLNCESRVDVELEISNPRYYTFEGTFMLFEGLTAPTVPSPSNTIIFESTQNTPTPIIKTFTQVLPAGVYTYSGTQLIPSDGIDVRIEFEDFEEDQCCLFEDNSSNSNTTSDCCPVYGGGLRVQSIKGFDKNILQYNKEYVYKDSLGCSSGRIITIPDYVSTSNIMIKKTWNAATSQVCGDKICHYISISSGSNEKLNNTNSGFITYITVEELYGINGDNGKSISNFSFHRDKAPSPYNSQIFINESWRSGKLLRNRNFLFNPVLNQFFLSNQITNEYQEVVDSSSILLSWRAIRILHGEPCDGIVAGNFGDYYTVKPTEFANKNMYLTQSTSMVYDEFGLNPITTITNTDYNYQTGNVIKTETLNSDNTVHGSRMVYVDDFNLSPVNSSSGFGLGLAKLKEKNIVNTPVESLSFIKKSGQSEKVIASKFIDFSVSNPGKPKSIYHLHLNSPYSNFQTSANLSSYSSINTNSQYVNQGVFDYNADGRISKFTGYDNIPTTFFWDHESNYLIGYGRNILTSNSAYTSFEFQGSTSSFNGGWAIIGTHGYDVKSPYSGDRSLHLQAKTSLVAKLSETSFHLSFAYRGSVEVFINGVSKGSFSSQNWTKEILYIEDLAATGAYIELKTPSGNGYLDEVKIHYSEGNVNNYCHSMNRRNVAAVTSTDHQTALYEFDEFDRLSVARNQFREVLGINNYVYRNQLFPTNFIQTTSLLKGNIFDPTQIASLSKIDERNESTNHIDGFGRVIQSISAYSSPDQNDIITFNEYDIMGREVKSYLPYTKPHAGGAFNPLAKAEQSAWYLAGNGEIQTPFPYSESLFEKSAASRVLKSASPGYSWRMGSNHEVKMTYGSNEANEVRIPTTGAYYPANTLTKVTQLDENGAATKTYTDKLGRTVLVRKYVKDTLPQLNIPGSQQDHHLYADTYTGYTDFGEVLFVMPPQAVRLLEGNGWNVNDMEVQSLVLYYQYDERRRPVISHVPNAGITKTVFNNADIPVLTQTENQRLNNTWTYNKYDALKRSVMTGDYIHSNSSAPSISSFSLFEKREPNTQYGYSNVAFPDYANTEIGIINYYDNYVGFNPFFSINYSPDPEFPTNPIQYVPGSLTSTVTKLPFTGQWIQSYNGYDKYRNHILTIRSDFPKVYEVLRMEYDFVRSLQKMKRIHIINGDSLIIRERYTYDHRQRLLETFHKVNNDDEVLLSSNTYNELDQLFEKNLHGWNDAGQLKFLQSLDYGYNERGWLRFINELTFDPNNGPANKLNGDEQLADSTLVEHQKIDSEGNPINQIIAPPTDDEEPEVNARMPSSSNDDNDDLFALRLDYKKTDITLGAVAQYNGNISRMIWKSATRDKEAYGFKYDGLDRLLTANHAARDGNGNLTNSNRYNTAYDYDLNGNITHVERKGYGTSSGGFAGYIDIDDMSYTYYGNKLNYVEDSKGTSGFADQNTTQLPDYDYDANGNMIADRHKGITLQYNRLNLPTKVTWADGRHIIFDYDYAGVKHRKTVIDAAGNTLYTHDYMSGIEYRDGELYSIMHAEGRIVPINDTLHYEYTLRDHLGNGRVYISDRDKDGSISPSEILQIESYYPFGMAHGRPGSSTPAAPNAYTYNGKELNTDFNLDLADYGARWYDSQLGRWAVVDPMAVKYLPLSPYNYTANNPIKYIDPDGMRIEYAYDDTKTRKQNRKLRREFRKYRRELTKKSPTARNMWRTLKKSKNVHTIHLNRTNKNADGEDEKRFQVAPKDGYTKEHGGGTDIYIHMDVTVSEGRDEGTPIIGIAHEFAHSFRRDQGLVDVIPEINYGNGIPIEEQLMDMRIAGDKKAVTEEREASHIENIVRAEIDPSGKIHPLRPRYSNILQRVNPITRKIQVRVISINTIKDGYRYYK